MSDQQPTKREPLSLAIKESIRCFHQAHEKMTISDMVLWAEEKYGIPFLPATMRTILFPKPQKPPLWAVPQPQLGERKRDRPPSWPELELELAKWYVSSTIPPKGQEVKEKAMELWRDLAPIHYIGQKQPGFGDSWRDKFKSRHGFKLGSKSIPEKNTEMEAGSVTGRATNTDNPLDFYYKTVINRVTRCPSSEYMVKNS
jgi:hypothetical protein